MPHLMVNNSALVLVMLTTWWIVLIVGLSWVWICAIDVVTEFLMLVSDAMMAIKGEEEDSKTILSRVWARNLLFFSLLSTKEIRSEKLSMTQKPGENSQFKGSKDGKHLLNLLAESIK